MKLLHTFLLFIAFLPAAFPQSAPARLIVRGDDMGYTHSGNEALIKCFKEGIETSIEVIVPSPWFPEAVKMLNENPSVDIGIHLAITSEWDNIKWRPLTDCKSLRDKNGYFYPMIYPNKNYPGQAVLENKWTIEDVEKEFRAQIELGMKSIPRVSHISGHMNCAAMTDDVKLLTKKLAKEYNIDIDLQEHNVNWISYDGPSKTPDEKIQSFTKMLEKLEPGKTYMFLDHPGFDNDELKAVSHIGYENVSTDRQGVTELFTSKKIKQVIQEKNIQLVSYNDVGRALPRSTPEKEQFESKAVSNYLKAVKEKGQDLHSFMILRHGKVIAEQWFGDNSATKNHVMHSVSKTFTATAIGFAVQEKRLSVTDKVISFFPNDLPKDISPNLAALEIKHLLTMSVGHDTASTVSIRDKNTSWERMFLALPVPHEPGKKFVYNSLASYMLSAIIQKVTGEKLLDYLYPRLLRPLGITGAEWLESPTGINTGGWGLFIKTEDMAKMGQFYLQKGKWDSKQLLPEAWFDEATKAHIIQPPVWVKPDANFKESDWVQGYGYQLWRCRNNAYRADGANGQFIIILPEKDAVIVTTANIQDMQTEINLIWKYLLPAFR
jgi:CubicO group peptidase (beta-lactamase class C family)/predicted glycoside hydrolase/deacetylase ChbG (UPF0249 family)